MRGRTSSALGSGSRTKVARSARVFLARCREGVLRGRFPERLEAFAGEVLAEAMNRPVQQVNGGLYLRGLLEQGARKSLESMVERLGADAEYQSSERAISRTPHPRARRIAISSRSANDR